LGLKYLGKVTRRCKRRRRPLRQPLMRPDHEIAMRQELLLEPSQDLLLQRWRKIGEGDVAAKY
jgi:hypothetical protein